MYDSLELLMTAGDLTINPYISLDHSALNRNERFYDHSEQKPKTLIIKSLVFPRHFGQHAPHLQTVFKIKTSLHTDQEKTRPEQLCLQLLEAELTIRVTLLPG